MKKVLLVILSAIVVFTLSLAQPAFAAVDAPDVTAGAKIFSANCAACHLGGNNVIVADKTLKKAALEKYLPDFETRALESVMAQVKNGKNAMPAFNGRLSKDQIADVAAYVLAQAQKGW